MSAEIGSSGAVRGAVAAAADAVAELDQDEDQLELLAPTRFADERGDEQRAKVAEFHRARGRGRPPGSRNKATRELTDMLRTMGADPLHAMARWARHTPETLAKELGCTYLEAFDRLVALHKELLPYFHARLAPVDGQGNAVVPTFNMIFGGGSGAPGEDGEAPWMQDPEVRARIVEHERNQQVSGEADEKSHAEKSHDDASD